MPNANKQKTKQIQNYEVLGGKHFGQKAITLIRAKLKELGLDALIVPHEDEWQNEYLPPRYDRLQYATGFTGSAGAAIIATGSAHMFVDGRYTLQVKAQTDAKLFEYHSLIDAGLNVWLKQHAKPHSKIGYDPRLITPDNLNVLQEAARENEVTLVELDQNPIDQIWGDRPAAPLAEIVPHANEIAGENSASKRSKIAEDLTRNGIDCAILTSPASLAWLYNIRGGDVIRSPLPLGSAILKSDGTSSLFVNPLKTTPELRAHLGNGVTLHDEEDFEATLATLTNAKVLVDAKLTSAKYFNVLEAAGAQIVKGDDPTTLPRAMKNPTEIKGMTDAHIRDGVAMAKFLHWFDENALSGKLTEIDACTALEGFRAQLPELKDLSFDSISGAMGNAASPHYRVNSETNTRIERNSLFLIDSGGQYLDGTTDITRTISVGDISAEMKDRFTRVLKGHIALATVAFPANTPGCMLDTLARMALWEAGLDYDHGTGHGVGAYLGVHEGPHRIAKALQNVALRTGMVVSNEPGFYKAGEFGIRIENLQYVAEASVPEGGERAMHRFITLTLAPIDVRAILRELLSDKERDWLNAYHARVAQVIGPYLQGAEREWLIAACRGI
ncbi:MAG: Xaa-Pro aminopeptidase [Hyphomonadaceae bacterium]|nr:MAG: Xaa-Pro aminopeptidase [Hyphomonadaceae bacterium]